MATSPKTRASLSTRFAKAPTTSGVRLRSQKFSAYWEPQTQNGEVWSCLDCYRQGCAKGRRIIGAKEKVGAVKEHRTVSAFIHSAIQP
jgi:hypothetical protein